LKLDPAVARAKFDFEVEKVLRHESGLRKRGCWILKCDYPNVDALFVPQRPLRIIAPGLKFSILSWVDPKIEPMAYDFHFLSARQFGVRIGLDNFDQCPPSVTFCDPIAWGPLDEKQAPPGGFMDDTGKIIKAIPGKHPHTQKPFLCVRGVREYHDHPEHSGDSWHLYRSNIGLFSVLSTICETFIENVQPELIVEGLEYRRRY